MMPEIIQCPGCGKDYRVTASLAGRYVRCKACKTEFRIPALENPFASLDDGADDWTAIERNAATADPLARSSHSSSFLQRSKAVAARPQAKLIGKAKRRGRTSGKKNATTPEELVSMFLTIMLLVYGLFLRHGRPVGIYTASMNAVFAMILLVIACVSIRHKSARVLFGTFGAFLCVSLFTGTQLIAVMSKKGGGGSGRKTIVSPVVPPDRSFRKPASNATGSSSTSGAVAPDLAEIRRRMQQRVDHLRAEHGRDKVVTVYGEGFPTEAWARITSEMLAAMSGATCVRGPMSGNRLVFVVAPFADVQEVADRIHFAEVAEVDPKNRTLTLRVDAAKLPEDMRPIPSNPRDPAFYTGNLAALRSKVGTRQAKALRNLKDAQPKELRKEIAKAIQPLLLDANPLVRQDALVAYAAWSTSDIVPELIRALDDNDPTVRNTALDELAKTKDARAVAPMVALLKTDIYTVAPRIKLLGPVAGKAVAGLLADRDQRIQRTALAILKEIGVPKESTSMVTSLLRSSDSLIRSDALQVLATTNDPTAIKMIAELLLESQSSYTASATLKKIGAPGEEAVAAYLSHSDAAVRRRAMDILKEIATPKSMPVLLVALHDSDITVRSAVLAKFVQWQAPETIAPIAQLLMTSSTRYAASAALKKFGSPAEDVVLKGLDLHDRNVVRECAKILAVIGTKKSIKPLTRLTRSKDVSVRLAAQTAGRAIMARSGRAVKGD